MIEIIENKRLGESYQRLVHPSGLVILLYPKRCVTTYASLVVRYGAQDTTFILNGREYTTPDGVAHFLEHKMFACPDGSDANELFSALGADANAWTDYDKTAYLFSTTEPADAALRTLIEFVSEPYFTRENVCLERGIIGEEIAMGEDDPWQILYTRSMRAMYHRHGIRRKICGTATSIGRITHKTLQLCYDAFYRPDNMYLIVCGDMDMDRVLAAVDEPLAAWRARTATSPVGRVVPTKELTTVKRRHTVGHGGVSQPIFRICCKDSVYLPDALSRVRREIGMSILSEMLFCRAGDFYHELFEAGKLSPAYSYECSTLDGHSPLSYHAVVGEADDPSYVFDFYTEYVKRVKAAGLSREDFERIRRVLYAGFVAQFDYPDDIAELLCEAEGDGRRLFDALDAIGSITFEEVEALLLHSFDPDMTVFSTMLPDRKTKEEQ